MNEVFTDPFSWGNVRLSNAECAHLLRAYNQLLSSTCYLCYKYQGFNHGETWVFGVLQCDGRGGIPTTFLSWIVGFKPIFPGISAIAASNSFISWNCWLFYSLWGQVNYKTLYNSAPFMCETNSEGFWKLMEVQKMNMNIHCKLDVVWASKGMMGVYGKFHAVLHLGMRSGPWVQRQQLLCMLRRHTLTCSCRFVASVQHFSSLLNWNWFLKLRGSTCFVQVGLWYWSTCELCRILCEVVLINC